MVSFFFIGLIGYCVFNFVVIVDGAGVFFGYEEWVMFWLFVVGSLCFCVDLSVGFCWVYCLVSGYFVFVGSMLCGGGTLCGYLNYFIFLWMFVV